VKARARSAKRFHVHPDSVMPQHSHSHSH
jgi:hypothetical protein